MLNVALSILGISCAISSAIVAIMQWRLSRENTRYQEQQTKIAAQQAEIAKRKQQTELIQIRWKVWNEFEITIKNLLELYENFLDTLRRAFHLRNIDPGYLSNNFYKNALWGQMNDPSNITPQEFILNKHDYKITDKSQYDLTNQIYWTFKLPLIKENYEIIDKYKTDIQSKIFLAFPPHQIGDAAYWALHSRKGEKGLLEDITSVEEAIRGTKSALETIQTAIQPYMQLPLDQEDA